MAEYLHTKVNVLKNGIHVITSPFGTRTLNGATKMHNGVDLVSNSRSDGTGFNKCDYIVAFADGEVTATLNSCNGKTPSTGNYVKIRHADGTHTAYYHLGYKQVNVKAGDKVKKGQTLGYMGSTGNSTGAHLHFGVMSKAGEWVNPLPYLRGEKTIEDTRISVKLRTLSKGDHGNDIRTLQTLLKAKDYKDSENNSLVIDGSIGSKTLYALRMFQKANSLTVDGICGSKTWERLING